MSKASDWLKAPTFPREDLIWRGTWAEPRAYPVLMLTRVDCVVVEWNGGPSVQFTKEEALDFARWILDTFAESAGARGGGEPLTSEHRSQADACATRCFEAIEAMPPARADEDVARIDHVIAALQDYRSAS